MSSPKGNSKHPQSFVYKDGESKLIEQSEFDAHIADGWCDNPDGVATAAEEVAESEPAPDAEEIDPVVDESADEETGTNEAE